MTQSNLKGSGCGCATTGGACQDDQTSGTTTSFRAPVDVIETDDGVIVRADVPGVSPDSVSVEVRGDTLELRAPVTRPIPEGAKVLQDEYGVGDWERTLRLGPTIDRERITARCTNGVLEVRLPKRTDSRKRRIEVHPS